MAHDRTSRGALNRHSDAAFNLLQYDMMAEKAASLGHHARLAEASVKHLRAFDASGSGGADERLHLLRKAAGEVWAYFVQREACGMRDHREIIKDFGIPNEVLARLGAVE
jgi:hypothetical protein